MVDNNDYLRKMLGMDGKVKVGPHTDADRETARDELHDLGIDPNDEMVDDYLKNGGEGYDPEHGTEE